MKANAVIVFPNTNMEVDAQIAWTTKACCDFLREISEFRVSPMAAAVEWPYAEGSRNSSGTDEIENFHFISLGNPFVRSKVWLSKVVGYFLVFLRMLFQISKKPTWYIFLPGHIGTLACLVCCLLGNRYGIYVRGEWKNTGVVGFLYRHYFAKATFIVTTGKAFAKRLEEYNDHVQEVAPMMSFRAADLSEKQSYKIDGSAVMLYVGQLHSQKGIFELVDAVSQIEKSHAVQLILVGDGSPEEVERIKNAIEEHDCRHLVTLAGRVDSKKELTRLFSEADLFAIPTYYPEGFPRVVYEAMCFGLPVVCTDIEGEMGFLRNGENCMYVERRSASDLAEKVSGLLSSEELRKRLGEEGFQDVGVLCKKFENTTHGIQVMEAIESYGL